MNVEDITDPGYDWGMCQMRRYLLYEGEFSAAFLLTRAELSNAGTVRKRVLSAKKILRNVIDANANPFPRQA